MSEQEIKKPLLMMKRKEKHETEEIELNESKPEIKLKEEKEEKVEIEKKVEVKDKKEEEKNEESFNFHKLSRKFLSQDDDELYDLPWRLRMNAIYKDNELPKNEKIDKISEEYAKIFSNQPLTHLEDLFQFESDDIIESYDFNSEGNIIAAYGESCGETILKIYDIEKRIILCEKKLEYLFTYPCSVVWNPDDSLIAITSYQCKAKIFKSNDLTEVLTIENDTNSSEKLVWNPSNCLLIIENNKACFWEIEKEEEYKATLKADLEFNSLILNAECSYEGEFWYFLLKESTIQVYDFEKKTINVIKDYVDKYIVTFTLTVDGESIWLGLFNGTCICVEIKTKIVKNCIEKMVSYPQNISCMNDNSLICYNDGMKVMVMRDSKRGNNLLKFENCSIGKWSKNQSIFVFICDEKISLINLFNVKKKGELCHNNILKFNVSSDESFIAIASVKENDRVLHLFSHNNFEKPVLEHISDQEKNMIIDFSSDSTSLLFSKDKKLIQWNLIENIFIEIYEFNEFISYIFNKDFKCYIGLNSGEIYLINLSNKEVLFKLKHQENTIRKIDVNLFENRLISIDDNQDYPSQYFFIYLLSSSYKEIKFLKIEEHEDHIESLSFSPDGTKFCSSGADCKMVLWDAIYLRKLFVFNFYFEPNIIKWSNNGKHIYCVSVDQQLDLINSAFGNSFIVKGKFYDGTKEIFIGKNGTNFYLQENNNIVSYEIIKSDLAELMYQKQFLLKMSCKRFGILSSFSNYYPNFDSSLHCAVYSDHFNKSNYFVKEYFKNLEQFPEGFVLYFNQDEVTPFRLAFDLNRFELVYTMLEFSIKFKEKIHIFHQIAKEIKHHFDQITIFQETLNLKELLDSRIVKLTEKQTPKIVPYFEGDIYYFINKEEDIFFKEFYNDIVNNEIEPKKCDNYKGIAKVGFYVLDIPDVVKTKDHFLETISKIDSGNDIFSSDFLEIVLDYKWNTYAKKYYMLEAIIYLIFVFLFCFYQIYIYHYRMLEVGFFGYHKASVVFEIIFITITVYFIVKELKQIGSEKLDVYLNFWNVLDLIIYFFFVIVSALDCFNLFGRFDNVVIFKCFSSVLVTALIIRLTSYLRMFKGAAFLIRMILQVIKDIKNFLVIMVIFIVSFSISFYILQVNENSIRMFRILRIMYLVTIGDFGDFFELSSVQVGVSFFFFMLGTIFLVIILLNLLISIVSDTYANISSTARQARIFEITGIINEIDSELPDFIRKIIDKKLGKYLMIISCDREINSYQENETSENFIKDIKKSLKFRDKKIEKIEKKMLKIDKKIEMIGFDIQTLILGHERRAEQRKKRREVKKSKAKKE